MYYDSIVVRFGLFIVLTASFVSVTDHVFVMTMPDFRSAMIGDLTTGASKEDIDLLSSKENYGDFVYLHLLSLNMDHVTSSSAMKIRSLQTPGQL
jgi:hypothetical protein